MIIIPIMDSCSVHTRVKPACLEYTTIANIGR